MADRFEEQTSRLATVGRACGESARLIVASLHPATARHAAEVQAAEAKKRTR
jgi:hypothetical protein